MGTRVKELVNVAPKLPDGVKLLEGELIPAVKRNLRQLRASERRGARTHELARANAKPPLPPLEFVPKHPDKPRGLSRAGMGRPKGAKNHLTYEVKEAIQMCFYDIGGRKKFAEWAKMNRTEFYKLYAKLLPIQFQAKETKELVITISKDENEL